MTIQEVVAANNVKFTLGDLLHTSKSSKIQIFKGEYMDMPVAIKRIAVSDERLYWLGKIECFNLRKISHPNFIRLLDYVEDGNYLFIILEFCEHKLSNINMSNDKEVKNFAEKIVQLLDFMDQNNLSHKQLDIKHVLFKRGPNGEMIPKLIDFGAAEFVNGRREWGSPNTYAVDVFCASQILVYAASQRFLQNTGARDLALLMQQSTIISENSSFLLASLINPMLAEEPEERPAAAALLRHIYLQNAEEVLQFINGCKSELMSHNCPSSEYRLETRCREVTSNNWHQYEYMSSLMDGRRYATSITDLLRLIRNKTEHPARYLPNPMSNPEEYLNFFTEKFPKLLAWTWHIMFQERHNLKRFYPDHDFVRKVPIEEILLFN